MSVEAIRAGEWEKAIRAAIAHADAAERLAVSVRQSRGHREAAEERAAARDALRAISREIPDPVEFAHYLASDIVAALLNARRTLEGFAVQPGLAADMRRLGLVGFGTPCLTAFGMAVRRALREAQL